ncbi:MAG: methyl-accepting chemotaxis protein [Sporolactobacillus sp.]
MREFWKKLGRNRWSGLSINQRYLINILIVFLLMTAAVSLSAFFLIKTGKAVQQVGAAGEQVARITEIGSLFREKDTGVVDYLLNPGDASIKAYTANQHTLTLAETKMQPLMRTPEQKQLLMQIMRNDSMSYDLFQNQFAPAVLMNDRKQALILRQQQNKLQIDTMNKLQQLRATVLDQQTSAVQQANAQITIAILTMSVSLLLAFLVCGLVTFRIQRSIRQSMKQVLEMTGKMASGDLRLTTQKMDGQDEIGQIGESVIRLNHHLKEMTQAIGLLTNAARKNSLSLANSVTVVTKNSTQVEQTLNDLSAGIQSQAEQTGDIAEKTSVFMKRVTDKADQAKATSANARSAIEVAESGQTVMNDSLQAMTEIRARVQLSSNQLNKLEAHIKQITEITESINSLAGQTNLLALNATIEAARAGSGDNGFSVIANSIRRLSNQTSDMSGQIGKIVHGIFSETKAVAEALAASQEATVLGEQKMRVTGEQFADIHDKMVIVGKDMSALTSDLEKISGFGTDIRQSVSGFAAVFEQTAAGIHEISQAIQGINQTIIHFSTEASNMQDKSGRLERLVSQFKYS